jgi:hypothetical protein
LALLAVLSACGPKGPAPPASRGPPAAQAPAGPSGQDLPGLAVIRAFYAPEAAPFPNSPDRNPYFTPELARALKRDRRAHGAGAADFDYRQGAQGARIADLRLTAVNTLDGERVVARFDHGHEPDEVDYDLVLTREGWRIADISAPAQEGGQAWSLRARLKLPAPDSEPPRRP